MSSGNFASHLRAAFLSGGTITRFAREEHVNGRRAFRYDYEVPPFLSQTIITVAGRLGGAPVQEYRRHQTTTEQFRVGELPGISTFFVKGDAFRLPTGLRMVWRTHALR